MTQQRKLSINRSQVLRWGGTLLSIFLLVYLFYRQGWNEIGAAFRSVTISSLLIGLGLILVSRLAVGFRWYVLMKATDVPVTIRDTIQLTFAGLFAANFLPTTVGGDVVRLGGAYQMGLDPVVAAASLVVDRLVGLAGMALAVPLGIGPLLVWFRENPGSFTLGSAFTGIWGKVKQLFSRGLKAVSMWYQRPGYLLGSLAFTLVHMACLFGMISVFLSGMGDPLPYSLVAGLWSFVYLVTLLPVSINGYGVQELIITLLYTQVGGIAPQTGLAIAVLVRTMMILASLPGAVFLPSIMAANRERPIHNPLKAIRQQTDPQDADDE